MKTIITFLALFFLVLNVQASEIDKKFNGEWITLSGKVGKVSADKFNLKVDGEIVLVEMDDFDWDADGYNLVKGDNVVVNGRVDRDFLEKSKVEASSVYVKGTDSYYFANSYDEEDLQGLMTNHIILNSNIPDGTSVEARGLVVRADEDDFLLDTGIRKIKVDVSDMSYNPLDEFGVIKINEGDRVIVNGEYEESFWSDDEIQAYYVREI